MSDVSRSVYQKVCEENKRLKADIEVLTSGKFDNEYITTLLKYRKIFRKENEFRELMKEAARQYIKEHPELNIPKI